MLSRISPLIAVALIGFTGGRLHAQPLAEHVPSDAVVYVGWAGIDSMSEGFEGSHFQGFLRAVDVPRLSEQVLGMIKTFAAQEDVPAAAGIDLFAEAAGAMWRHPTAFYLSGIDMTNPARPMPRLAVICKMGPGAKALRERIVAAAGAPPAEVIFEASGDLLILAMGMTLEQATRPAAALAGHARFKEAMEFVHQPADAVFYADAAAISKMVADIAREQATPQDMAMYEKVVEALGLNGLERIIVSGGVAEKDWVTRAFVETPAPRKGLVKLLESEPIDEASLKLIPSTATWVGVTSFDLSRAYDTIRAAVQEVEPQALVRLDQQLAQVNQQLGFDIIDGLVRSLGSSWIAYSDLSLGGPTAFALVHPLRDAAKFDQALAAVENIAQQLMAAQENVPIQLQRIEDNGMTLRTINFLFVSISWSVHEERLLLGMFPQSLVAAAENAKAQGSTILDQPKFQSLREKLGDRPVNALSYADLEATGPQAYQLAMMGVQFVQGLNRQKAGQPQPLILPPLNRLMPYFKPAMEIGWTDERGAHALSRSPFPGSTGLSPSGLTTVAATSMGVGILLPSLGRARELANRTMCGTRLNGLYKASAVWALAHEGMLPPDFGSLVEDGTISPKNLFCPSSGNWELVEATFPQEQEQWRAWSNENSDFIFLAAGKNLDALPADEIFAYEPLDHHKREGINICFGDGHVAFTEMSEALRLLREAGVDVPDQVPAPHQPNPFSGIFGRRAQTPAAAQPGDAWYYDTVTKEYFTDKTTRIAPFKRENGNEAVRAHFFSCGECGDEQRFIGYYEKYTPEVQKKLEESAESFLIYEMAFQGRLYSADGKTWVAANKPEGIRITTDLQKKCPPRKLRYCPPE